MLVEVSGITGEANPPIVPQSSSFTPTSHLPTVQLRITRQGRDCTPNKYLPGTWRLSIAIYLCPLLPSVKCTVWIPNKAKGHTDSGVMIGGTVARPAPLANVTQMLNSARGFCRPHGLKDGHVQRIG